MWPLQARWTLRLLAAVPSALVVVGAAPAQAAPPGPPPPPGQSTAASVSDAAPDFDGDSFDDLAIGALHDDVPGFAYDEGSVTVLYGEASGLTTGRAQYWNQGTTGIADSPEAYDQFGFSTSWGDFDGDGFDDLVVGVPQEQVALDDEGVVQVIYGSATGLTAAGDQLIRSPIPQQGNYFGSVLSSGDFDGDGFDDLAVSAPRYLGQNASVSIFFGRASDLDLKHPLHWTEQILGLRANSYSWFGASLAAGDTNGDGFDDLAIGIPSDYVGSELINAGSVALIMGSADGLVAASLVDWSQDTPGVPGKLNRDDAFGIVAMGDLDADGFDDLVVGAPGDDEDGGPAPSVTVISGSAGGLTSAGSTRWDQRIKGVGDKNERADWFGDTLAIADYNGDGADDVAIGNPRESVRTDGVRIAKTGEAVVLYGGSAGLSIDSSQRWNQDSRRIKDVAEKFDAFSYSMVAGDFDADGSADLVLGTIYEDDAAGVVQVIRGAARGLTGRHNQRWTQDSPGMPGEQHYGHFFGCGMGSTVWSCDGGFGPSDATPPD